MKRLYLLRHAQALSSSDSGDKGRKLSPQGAEDAKTLGRLMARKNWKPALVLCSPAIRTRQTWEYAAESLGDIALRIPENFYNAGYTGFVEALEDVPDTIPSLLIVAHNPGIHDFAARLSSEDSPSSPLGRLIQGFKPGAIAVLDCPIASWLDLADEVNTLIDFQEPLDYNAPAGPTRWT